MTDQQYLQFTNVFSEEYNRKHGLTLGYIIYVLFFSDKTESTDIISHILDVAGIISIHHLKLSKTEISRSFLLKIIFQSLPNDRMVKKALIRNLVGLKHRGTFNKYFDNHIKSVIPKGYRGYTYTLFETYKILNYYQGGDVWGRMKIYSKGELASSLFGRNYEHLEVELNTNSNFKSYLNEDYIFPRNAKKLFKSHKTSPSISHLPLNDVDISLDCLYVFFYLYLAHSLQVNPVKLIEKSIAHP